MSPARQPDRPLRVGLNLVFIGAHSGGVGRYGMELPGALLAAAPETEIHLFVSRDAPRELRQQPWAQAVRWTTLPVGLQGPPLHLAAQLLALPAICAARRLDVLHSPASVGPARAPRIATVITLLDLIWLHRSEEWEPDAKRASSTMGALVSHCVRHADRLLAISETVADDYVRTLGVRRERIDVTPLGVREAPVATPERQLRARLQLGAARVVCCVAQKRPYKNLHRLVHALPELPEDVVLLLPGSPTPYEAQLRALAEQLGVAARVRFPDWLSDADLAGLYALSAAFVLPSLIEGFGLTVLEAMVAGTPVACSNRPALPETVGEAALLFDPERQDEVTGAVRRLLEDRALARELVERGRRRARELTWAHTGAATIAAYRRALAGVCG
ncbi:MAG: glycosyltransferase family 4 protein [Solirubrobacteraceae bacterium]